MILEGLITVSAVIAVSMVLVWGVSVLLEDVSIVDVFWGLGFVAVAWTTFLLSGARGPRAIALVAITTAWGVRLAAYLAWRNWGKGEDVRYRAMREARGERFWLQSLTVVFGFQGLLIVLVSLPLLVGIGLYGDRGLSILGGVGCGLCGVGLFFEWVGDWQLTRFQSVSANRGKVMDRGLWAWTRHPNYFGDFLVWWGIAAIASPEANRAWVLVGPAIMTFMLLKVSGVALLEETIGDRPGYSEYVQRTSAFIPWPPKS